MNCKISVKIENLDKINELIKKAEGKSRVRTITYTNIKEVCDMIEKIEDLDMRELITLFVGRDVSAEQRVRVVDILEERFDELSVEVYEGGQSVYDYLIAVE